MKSATMLLAQLRQVGIEPTVLDGSRLGFPKGVLTEELREAVKQNKEELLILLRKPIHQQQDHSVDRQECSIRYLIHHFKCQHCIAAGQNPNLSRCATGLPLWSAYVSTVPQPT